MQWGNKLVKTRYNCGGKNRRRFNRQNIFKEIALIDTGLFAKRIIQNVLMCWKISRVRMHWRVVAGSWKEYWYEKKRSNEHAVTAWTIICVRERRSGCWCTNFEERNFYCFCAAKLAHFFTSVYQLNRHRIRFSPLLPSISFLFSIFLAIEKPSPLIK